MPVLWLFGPFCRLLSGFVKRQCPSVTLGVLMGDISSPSQALRMLLSAVIHMPTRSHSTQALLDSGAEQNLIDCDLVRLLGIQMRPLDVPVSVTALNGQSLPLVTHQTEPLSLILSGNHHKRLRFFVFSSPESPVVLGFPWFERHNLHIN